MSDDRRRRRYARFEREDFGLVLLDDGRELRDDGMVVHNISRKGLGLELSGRVDVGQRLSFRLDIPSGPILASGSVCWVSEHGLGYSCGVNIDGIGFFDGRRLRDFLEPGTLDLLDGFDQALSVSTAGVVLLLALHWCGIELASPREIFEFAASFIF